MSERRWTAAQTAAIEDEGGALLVSAAAGSGKTAVLVERAVRLITREEAPMPADRLLILTFTNAAAEELRSRIGVRLEEEVRNRGKDARLRAQRLRLRRAFIGTIDAFCLQLVREHFTALDLPPDVGLGDEGLWAQLSAQALADTMEEMMAEEAFAALSALYDRARSDATTEQAVLRLFAFTRTLPWPGRQLARLAAMYDSGAPAPATPWGRQLMDEAETGLDAAAHTLAEALTLAEGCPAGDAWTGALRAYGDAVGALLAAMERDDWDAAVGVLRGFAPPAFKAVRGADEAVKARVFAARDEAKKLLAELAKNSFACTVAEDLEDRRAARPMVHALAKAAGLYGEKYFEAKLAERALDFADFEHLALRLLQTEDGGRTPMAEAVAARYDAVMVDEYQDTNDLQNALYQCLARPEGDNLFFVGDVKQSIYRFRSANPAIFLAKKDAWAPYGEGRHPAVLPLGHNFRSGPGVIDGVNFLFSRLMSRALGEVDYGEDERLIAGGEKLLPGGVELCILQTEAAEDEAAYIAGRIEEMVAGGFLIEEGGGTRPCGYGDFCILLRAGTRMAQFAAALEGRGIPVTSTAAEDLLQTPEVLPLTAALAAIDNPGDDVNLAATLLGPLFGFAPAEVTRLRAETPRGGLWGALAASAAPRARQFMEEMAYYRMLAAEVGVGRLCEELVSRTGYLSAVAAMRAGAARRDNLLRFMGWAAQVSAGGRGGLPGFVRLMQAGAGPAPPAAKSLPGHVSLLTVHKSKGLEFPVCFLADTARQFNRQDLNARVQMHAQLGVGLALRSGDALYPTLPLLAIRSRAGQEALSEEMRMLYVALTRARQQMVMSFATKDAAALLGKRAAAEAGGRPDPYALGRCRSMAEWVSAALLCHPALAPAMLEWDGEELCAEAEHLAVRLMVPPRAGAAAEQEAFHLTAAPDEALAARLRAAFARQPPRAALAAVPAKVSVSAITKPGGPALLKRPSFMYKSGLTAAERGTAQHAFLQYADFAAAKAGPAEELARLRAQGYLTAEQADAVDLAGVAAFLASPLAGRVLAAGRVLREYDFITSVPAGQLDASLPEALAAEPVLVQGIADLVLVDEGSKTAEIVDYKTDHGVTAEELAARYAGQLALYRTAVQRRLGLPVARLTLWSFSLLREVGLDG